MRISDWSSACALPIYDDGPPAALVQDALRAAVVIAPVGAVEAVQAHRSAGDRGMDEAALADIDADVAHVAAAAEEHQVRREIGREACRERVCQYGESPVVAVT